MPSIQVEKLPLWHRVLPATQFCVVENRGLGEAWISAFRNCQAGVSLESHTDLFIECGAEIFRDGVADF
jgi:hypothetical protein